jgi:hypothetical protein
VNRRLTNLLSSGRLYVDQVKHEAGVLDCRQPELAKALTEKCSVEYDSKLGYRVMEALRNYTQHRDLPVHQLSFATTWEPEGAFKDLVYRVVPSFNVTKLAEDGEFKKAILAELSAIGPVVPLTPLVREYVEGVSMVHESFRSSIQHDMPRWEGQFDWVWQRYEEMCPGDGRVVEIFCADDEMNELTDREQIFSEVIEHRKYLARKNSVLTNLTRRYVSGSCELHTVR